LQSGQCGQRNSGGSHEIQTLGHVRCELLVDACLLGKSTTAILCYPRKDAVACAEPLDVSADGNNDTGEFVTQHKRKLGSVDRAKVSLSELEINRIETSGAHSNENLPRRGNGCRNIHEAAAFGSAVVVKDICADQLRDSCRMDNLL
jgi:hypothetical protein